MPTEPRVYRTPEEAQQLRARWDERECQALSEWRERLIADGLAVQDLSEAELLHLFRRVFVVLMDHGWDVTDPDAWQWADRIAALQLREDYAIKA